MSEEDEISLIVEGHDSSSLEFGLLRNQSSKESGDSSTDNCVEVVQNELGIMVGNITVMVNFVVQLRGGDLESGSRTLGKMDEDQLVDFLLVFSPDHDVGVALGRSVLADFLKSVISSGPIEAIGESALDFFEEGIDVLGRIFRGGHQDFGSGLLIEIFGKFIDAFLVQNFSIFFSDNGFVKFSLIVDGQGLKDLSLAFLNGLDSLLLKALLYLFHLIKLLENNVLSLHLVLDFCCVDLEVVSLAHGLFLLFFLMNSPLVGLGDGVQSLRYNNSVFSH